jgi:hypothetical protein
MRDKRSIALTVLFVLILSVAAATAQDESYKPFRREAEIRTIMQISFSEELVMVETFLDSVAHKQEVDRRAIKVTPEGEVWIGGQVLFDAEGAHVGPDVVSWERVHDIRVMDRDKFITITCLTHGDTTSRINRVLSGNVTSYKEPIVIEEDQFVRGMTFTVVGDVEAYGEVNGDIVSLFGEIYVGPEAVARGDIATINGRIDVAKEAAVYGEMFTAEERRTKARRRLSRREAEFDDRFRLNYNRVDGLYIQQGIEYRDYDSLLPSVWAQAGYALASERWRFEIGLEQTLLRSLPLAIEGQYYRRLASEDNWLLDDKENTAFALLAKEDFKDYYESEGAWVGLTARPVTGLRFEAGYFWEETKWLEAHRNLWSLFGGDKRFPSNYSSVDSSFRAEGISQLDSIENAGLRLHLDYDTRHSDDPFRRSSWHFTGNLEYVDPDLDSGYDYTRYMAKFRRYQRVHSRSMLVFRGVYGGSDGVLPMHKRFFLGGLGTLRGYEHKEYLGTEVWMANIEYRVRFPRTDLAAGLMWDVGQIANEVPLDDQVEVKHSLGAAIFLGDDFRLNVSRRLDGEDDGAQIYVRLEHVF